MEPVQDSSRSPGATIKVSAGAVFLIFLRLGFTSFGGPMAHLAAFREEFVTRRKWYAERSFADLLALCQFLPGPASSQVGISIGLSQAGYRGAFSAWAGFTLPSATALILCAVGIANLGTAFAPGVIHGLKVVTAAIVIQAFWGMARSLCQGIQRLTIMMIASCLALSLPAAWGQLVVIASAGVAGLLLFKPKQNFAHDPLPIAISQREGLVWLALFLILLIGLPVLMQMQPSQTLALIDGFYRSGALVFGGGHVVLPLLQAVTVSSDWVSNETFLAGYAAAQAMPGPLFTFAAFLGAASKTAPSGWLGGIIGLLAIFTPSFLLLAGVLPFWEKIRAHQRTQAALAGINAAVVGLLLAALYNPVWISAIHRNQDFGLVLIALLALMFWKIPPWLLVIGGGLAGWLLSFIKLA